MHHIHHYQLCKLWCSSLSFCFGSIRKCGFVAPCHLVKLLHAEICQNTFFFFFGTRQHCLEFFLSCIFYG